MQTLDNWSRRSVLGGGQSKSSFSHLRPHSRTGFSLGVYTRYTTQTHWWVGMFYADSKGEHPLVGWIGLRSSNEDPPFSLDGEIESGMDMNYDRYQSGFVTIQTNCTLAFSQFYARKGR